MITDKERLELEYLLNKEARKYNELFKSQKFPRDFIPDWIDYRCYYNSGYGLFLLFNIVICTGRRCILTERCTIVNKKHITRYYPIIKNFFAS